LFFDLGQKSLFFKAHNNDVGFIRRVNMHEKTGKQNKAELIVVCIALVAFVLGLVAHLAGASIANSNVFGYIAAPIPLVLGVIVLLSYKIAEAAED
tara:strand:+ start:619 stop:906 length:288 start_codon:yes stop_codon:yes gene_type:complete